LLAETRTYNQGVNAETTPQTPLLLLAIETSSDVGSVCLFSVFDSSTRSNAKLAAVSTLEVSAHGEKLSGWIVPAIDRLLTASNTTLSRIDAIAFGSGPGSFTGVRTACATAQALAYAHAKPLIAVPSMEALAALVDASTVTVALDARMGEIYVAGYQRNDDERWTETTHAYVAKPQDVRNVDAASTWIGSGVALLRAAQAATVGTIAASVEHVEYASLTQRWAEGVARAAVARFKRRDFVDPLLAEPIYVRNKVAFTEAERATA
jgi:tRNA threonylcarbamoyladenosine biosynthesis protein TsaB